MPNRKIFATSVASKAKESNTVNVAGGKAYKLSDEAALAQYVVTSCFNKTFYASDTEQVEAVKALANSCHSDFIAKAAVYGHTVAGMKDVPAYLLAHLAARKDDESRKAFLKAFPKVVSNGKMLMNFVQIIRSGATGRKSFGTAPKRAIRNWLESRSGDQLFTGSIGANPSMADIIKMVHPKPESDEKKAFYAYLIGRDYDQDKLPPKVQAFEAFKQYKDVMGHGLDEIARSSAHTPIPVPDVPFQMLTALNLTPEEWVAVVRQLPWNALRMNLNTAERHGVFTVKGVAEEVAAKLSDPELVRKYNVFPYQLLSAYLNATSVPNIVRNALQDAMEVATENVPDFGVTTAVCVDTSGSMQSPVTGHRVGSTTQVKCVDVAALFAASVARKNNTIILPFDTRVHDASSINPRDSVMTNADKLRRFGGGGTDCASALRALNHIKYEFDRPKVVIFVSDLESWFNGKHTYGYYRGTGMAQEWAEYKRKVRDAKLVLIDLQAADNTQVEDQPGVMNIGGFSDKVWPAIESFVKNSGEDFVSVVKSVDL